VNVGRLRHPLDDPRMPDIRDAIGRKEFLAEQAPGFVWRLATFGGHVAGDDLLAMPATILTVSDWRDDERTWPSGGWPRASSPAAASSAPPRSGDALRRTQNAPPAAR